MPKPVLTAAQLQQPEGRGIVLDEAGSGGKADKRQRRNETDVHIENILGVAAIGGLLEEWLVPTIVDRLIQDLTDSSLDGER